MRKALAPSLPDGGPAGGQNKSRLGGGKYMYPPNEAVGQHDEKIFPPER